MADIVTGTVSGIVDLHTITDVVSDVRREQANDTSDIRREIAKEGSDIDANVKEAAWKVIDRVETAADRADVGFDRVTGQDTAYFIAGQQNDFSNATSLAALKSSVDLSFAKTQADIALSTAHSVAAAQLAGEKNAAAAALGQALIGQQIMTDGNSTRALLNELKMAELNRVLTERHNELVEERGAGRYNVLQSNLNAMQYQVASQLNALNSQMQETRQGIVNFGSMGGHAGQQTSTSNNVR